MVTFLLVMTNAYRFGWVSPVTIGVLCSSVSLLLAFVYWERRASQPVLALELFSRRTFALGSSASFFGFLAATSVFSMMPFYLQGVIDLSPRSAGLYMAPAALGFAIAGPLSGTLSDRFGPRGLEFGGLAMLTTSLFLLGRLTVDTSPTTVSIALAMQGFGMGIFYTPNTSSILGVVEQARYGVATAFLNMTRNTANVTGVGMATSIATMVMAARGFEPSLDAIAAGGLGVGAAFTQGIRIAFLIQGGFIIVSIVLTALKPPEGIEAQV